MKDGIALTEGTLRMGWFRGSDQSDHAMGCLEAALIAMAAESPPCKPAAAVPSAVLEATGFPAQTHAFRAASESHARKSARGR